MSSFALRGLDWLVGRCPSDESLGYFRLSLREFPSEVPSVLVMYRFDSPMDDIYATLVVRLHHTLAFQSTDLWKSAPSALAQVETSHSPGWWMTLRRLIQTNLREIDAGMDVAACVAALKNAQATVALVCCSRTRDNSSPVPPSIFRITPIA